MANNILVTGGTGLVGMHLLAALHAKGIRANAIYRKHIPAFVAEKANWLQTDILDVDGLAAAMANISEVYHVAGMVSFRKADKKQLHKINVEGTANVVNAALAAGVRKMVHVSSVAALGRIRKDVVINEQMQWTPETSNSEYGKTKYLGELEVWRGIAEGLEAAIVNPTIVFGEYGNWNDGSMKIFQSVRNGFPYYTMGETGFVDANDVAEIMIRLMQGNISSQRFVISGENKSYKDVLFAVADGFGVKRPHKAVTPALAAIAWRIEKLKSLITGNKPLITKETAATGLAAVRFDNSKILKALPGFSFTAIEETIGRICRHYSQMR